LTDRPREQSLTTEDRTALTPILSAEYGMLMAALGAAWAASLSRTSIFLVVLSATGVALGFVAPGGGENLRVHALVVVPLVLFLGVATFIRLVQVQRESIIYITGQNRIRRFFADSVPAARPYFVLPLHDDPVALFRSPGTGMNRRQPRFPLLYLVVQTQGIVGVITAAIAAVFAGIASLPLGAGPGWVIAAVAFFVTLAALFAYWQRSLRELWAAIRPRYPTPPDDIEAPF
jgi:hypothetical protein